MDDEDFNLPVDVQLPQKQQPSQANYGFDPKMAFELALGVDDTGDVLARYGVSKDSFIKLSKNELFRKTFAAYKRDIRENGHSFRLKAKIQAEQLLDTAWVLIHDQQTPPSVKLEGIKSLVRWADLEPDKKQEQSGGGQFNIQINLGGS